ncbi:unnamed protein product [Arabis nemorensis]|uniref:Uncharacterized protein n=1 Tax=Arabis nemorensis TaxID=586526 RepID=A0A565AZA0_9BRAS|nr:unnamed protein product [Arabis nemorensis]
MDVTLVVSSWSRQLSVAGHQQVSSCQIQAPLYGFLLGLWMVYTGWNEICQAYGFTMVAALQWTPASVSRRTRLEAIENIPTSHDSTSMVSCSMDAKLQGLMIIGDTVSPRLRTNLTGSGSWISIIGTWGITALAIKRD